MGAAGFSSEEDSVPAIAVLAELERLEVAVEYTGNDAWVSIVCPFHDDKNPSCGVNTETGSYKCHACGAKGDVYALFSGLLKAPRQDVMADLAFRYGLAETVKPIDPKKIDEAKVRLQSAGPLLKELERRGVSKELAFQHSLGESRGRITIPIYDSPGVCTNLIRYSPGAPQKKFLHSKGRGNDCKLYPLNQLGYSRILLTGGPLKALAASHVLNPHGIGVLASSNGENADGWPKNLGEVLSGKSWVGVCLDIDDAGELYAQQLLAKVYSAVEIAAWVKLPLDPSQFPKGDISDFLGQTDGDLLAVIDAAEEWHPKRTASPSQIAAADVDFKQAAQARMAAQRLRFNSLVVGLEREPYYLPKTVQVRCNRDQPGCYYCPVFVESGDPQLTIDPESPALLAMIGAGQRQQRDGILQSLGMPPCKVAHIEPQSYYHAVHAALGPERESLANTDEVSLGAVAYDLPLSVNSEYTVEGSIVPHPCTQKATAVISKADGLRDSLDDFELKSDDLKVFQPEKWTLEGLTAKLDTLYKELAVQVTGIFERPLLHLLLDLAWHSVLYIPGERGKIKGWVESLIVGDSAIGKSQTANRLLEHYGLGTKVDCKIASVAGLIGGVQQMNGRFFISWGILPANDRRLVLLEELKGAHPEIIAKLTETRSSGVADIPKIERGTAKARCRLAALSNPRSSDSVDAYAFGTQILNELIPNPEDIRRFDIFGIFSDKEVSKDIGLFAESASPNGTLPVYTSEACRHLILWGWTREAQQVVWEDWTYLVEQASKAAGEYIDSPPILDRGSARYKVARLATSLAVRTFSHGEDLNTVLVRRCHVDYVVNLLHTLYRSQSFGFDRVSKNSRARSELRNPQAVTKGIINLTYPADFIECCMSQTDITPNDIAEWCGMDILEAREFVSLLVRNNAITRVKRYYRKSAGFTRLLDDLRTDEQVTRKEPPPYIHNQEL